MCEIVCRVMRAVDRDARVRQELISGGTIELLVTALSTHASNAPMLLTACDVLVRRRCSSAAPPQERAPPAGPSPGVARSAKRLWRACQHQIDQFSSPPVQPTLRAAPGFSLLVPPLPSPQASLCLDDKASARAVAKGAVETVVVFILKTHRDDPQLQQARLLRDPQIAPRRVAFQCPTRSGQRLRLLQTLPPPHANNSARAFAPPFSMRFHLSWALTRPLSIRSVPFRSAPSPGRLQSPRASLQDGWSRRIDPRGHR